VRLIRQPEELQPGGRKVCIAIGTFDGVHLGHQQVIRQAISDAASHQAHSLVVTFDKHPQAVLAPERAPALIYSLPQKLRASEQLGAEALLLIDFDRAFSQQTGEAFVRRLVSALGQVHSICVGGAFVFGHKRSGNVDLLKTLGAELRFGVHGLAAVSLGGRMVSSTRIRERIKAGDFDAASQMMGRPYSIAAKVQHGDRLGRTIGFPTANLDVAGLMLPPTGVYAAQARVRGQMFGAAVNLGYRPTVNDAAPVLRMEAHLLDFAEDIYGEELELFPIEKLRDEQRFAGLDALKHQIALDILNARRCLQ